MNNCKCETLSPQVAIGSRMTITVRSFMFPRTIQASFVRFLCAIFIAFATQMQAAQSVTLAWDANSEPDIAGYTVRYGTSSGAYTLTSDAGNSTTTTISNLTDGLTYFIAVTAHNSAGLESLPSQEVSFLQEKKVSIPIATINGKDFFNIII